MGRTKKKLLTQVCIFLVLNLVTVLYSRAEKKDQLDVKKNLEKKQTLIKIDKQLKKVEVDKKLSVKIKTEEKLLKDKADKAEKKAVIQKTLVKKSAQSFSAKIEERKQKLFVSFGGGYIDYPALKDVESLGSLGLSFGVQFKEGVLIELDAYGSRFNFRDLFHVGYSNGFDQMNQLNLMSSIKYGLKIGKIQPYIGVTAGYIFRQHLDLSGGEYLHSGSLDAGAVLGINFILSDRMSIGVSGRYLSNLYTGAEQFEIKSDYKPLERSHHYTIGSSLNLSF